MIALIVGAVVAAVVLVTLVVYMRRPPTLKTMYIATLEACASMGTEEVVKVGPAADEVSFTTRHGIPIITFYGSDMSMTEEAWREWSSNVSTWIATDDLSTFTTQLAAIVPESHKGRDVVCVSHSRGGYLMSAWCRDAPQPPTMAVFIGSPGQTFDCRTRGTHVKAKFKHRLDPVTKLGWVTSDHEHEFTEVTPEFSVATVHTVGYFVLIKQILDRVRLDGTNDYSNHLTVWP